METCFDGYCSKCHAAKLIVFGIILILVRWYYAAWDIWIVLGVLVVLKGIIKLAMPSCSHCQSEMKKAKK